MKNSKNKI